MASVTFKRGTKAEIENTQIQDGQLLMETDQLNNNKIYLDLPNGTRVPVGGSGAWVGTKEEFELAVEEGKIADGTQVIITDDYESGITASMTLYSNAQSGLVATNVQSAIDELNSNLKSKVKSYSSIPSASDLKSAIAVFCALRNSADTFSSFQGLIPNMKTKYIDISTGSVVLKDITWSKTNGTITGDMSSYEVRFIYIF